MFDYVKNKYNLMTYMYDFVTIQQVSGSINLQLVVLLKYSGPSDNTATQRIYNKSNVQCMLYAAIHANRLWSYASRR